MVKIILMIGAILMLWSSSATAQRRLAVGHGVADLRKLCPGIQPGNNALRACMREHIRDVSFHAWQRLLGSLRFAGFAKSAARTFTNSVWASSVEEDSSGLA